MATSRYLRKADPANRILINAIRGVLDMGPLYTDEAQPAEPTDLDRFYRCYDTHVARTPVRRNRAA